MNCRLPLERLETFASCIQSIGKIGKELLFEVTDEEFALSTLNDSRSACGEFIFLTEFFDRYTPPKAGIKIRCKIFIKSIQFVFRSLKNLKSMQISFEVNNRDEVIELVFRLECEQKLTKTHSLKVQDCEVMHAKFDHDLSLNFVTARVYDWNRILFHLHDASEVCIIATDKEMQIESYHFSSGSPKLQTMTTVAATEFSKFEYVSSESKIGFIFCWKEFKAFLAFCEATDSNEIKLLYSSGGNPILFTTRSPCNNSFYANLTLATMPRYETLQTQSSSDAA